MQIASVLKYTSSTILLSLESFVSQHFLGTRTEERPQIRSYRKSRWSSHTDGNFILFEDLFWCANYISSCAQSSKLRTLRKIYPDSWEWGFLLAEWLTRSTATMHAWEANIGRKEGSLSTGWWWVQRGPIRGLAWFRMPTVTDRISGITLLIEPAARSILGRLQKMLRQRLQP